MMTTLILVAWSRNSRKYIFLNMTNKKQKTNCFCSREFGIKNILVKELESPSKAKVAINEIKNPPNQ